MPHAQNAPRILIVGAGLAGSLLAVLLAKQGFRVALYERRPDPRAAGYVGGRSINLALSARGIAALARAGLVARVMSSDALPMRGRMIHPPSPTGPAGTSPLAFQPYSANPADAINSVSRGGLNLTLLHAAAEMPLVEMQFNQCCIDVDPHSARPAAAFATVERGGLPAPGAATQRVEADLILAADGAFSPVRGTLQRTDRFDYSQSYLGHGYKELHIPPTPAGEFALDPAALHIWPRGGAMMIALPNRDRSFTCTLFWPMDGAPGELGLNSQPTDAEVLDYFTKHYADAVPLMPTLARDFRANPASSLVTVRCFPWQYQGRVALLGDAAHAIVPFFGQGMNCAFEDCVALVDTLNAHGADARGSGGGGTLGDTRAALDAFQHARKPHADAIADMALDNFIEMRDKVGSPAFRYRKKVEQALHALFPDRCEPLYHLVSFATVPYAEARARGRALDALYDAVIASVPPEATFPTDEAWREGVRKAAEAWLARRPGTGTSAGHANTPHDDTSPLIDISPPLSPDTRVWPGDTPLSREVLCELSKGDSVTLSTLRSTVHLGSHADGPNHYAASGRSVGEQRLQHYIGPCQVIHARATRATRGTRVGISDLLGPQGQPGGGLASIHQSRVLIRTGTFEGTASRDATGWNDDFAALAPELIDALAARGVITLGVDTPSVDLMTSKDLPAHAACARHDMAIIEGLVLDGVPPGVYDLSAAPLKLMGFDGSPVRAVLRRL